jgi:hypothetical protein
MSPSVALMASILSTAAIGAKPVATVNLGQVVQPKTPLASQYMQIAVMNANMEGSSGEFDEKKWSTMTADMVQYYLEQAGEKYQIPLKLVDREHLKVAQGEKDLASAGVSDGGDAVGAAQFKGASAILTSKVTVKIDKQVAKKKRINPLSVVGAGLNRGYGVHSEEVEAESRNITVNCQFQLKDPATNDIIVSHNAPPTQEFNNPKASPFFGSGKTEANMTPRDAVIGGMIEKDLQDFLCKFVPVEIKTEVQVKPSRHKESIAGVESLVAEDFPGALDHFKKSIAAKKDEASYFGAGVCCEKLKQYEEARKYYKIAQSMDVKNPEYNAAVARISKGG